MTKTILITGYQGLIGRHLFEYYRERWDYVVGLGRGDNFQEVVEDLNIDYIIHCAGEIYNEFAMFNTNVELTRQILEYVKANPNVEMVNISSSSVYGKVDHVTSESNMIIPQDIYSMTKGIGSLLSIGYGKKYNLKITDVRPYTIYGIGEKEHKLLPKLWRAFSYDEPMVICDGMHDWTYIDDFVDGINKILNKKDKPYGDIVNIGSGIQTSNFEIFEIYVNYFGYKPKSVELKNDSFLRDRDTKIWQCDNRYSKEFYEIKYKYTIEEGIFTMLNKFKENYDQNT